MTVTNRLRPFGSMTARVALKNAMEHALQNFEKISSNKLFILSTKHLYYPSNSTHLYESYLNKIIIHHTHLPYTFNTAKILGNNIFKNSPESRLSIYQALSTHKLALT